MGSIYIWAVYFYFFVLTVLPVQESRPSKQHEYNTLKYKLLNRNLLSFFSTRHKEAPLSKRPYGLRLFLYTQAKPGP